MNEVRLSVMVMFSCLHHDIWHPTLCVVWGSCCCALKQWERGKASLNVGCCVIPPRAPLLFLCLGPHVTVGYFLWWLARINRSSNVHPVSQQLHDWWDFTLLIYFIIVTQTWGEWWNGLCSMRNVTCDCRYGTGDYSNVRFVWGLYLISECQLLYELRLFPIRPCALCHSDHSKGLLIDSACDVLCCCYTTTEGFTIQLLWSRSSPYDIYGFVVSVRLHAYSL